VGEVGAELFTTRFSMLLVVVGLLWLLLGPNVMRILRFPLAFLFLMLPLPGFVQRNLTFPLQLVSSAGAVKLMNLIGISAFREGNVIDIGLTQLQVVEACNGLRYILPLLTFGVLFAYMAQKVVWKRVVLVAATIPIAIFANMIRVAGAGVSSTYWGTETVEGFFHATSALVVIMFCALLFVLFNWFLNRVGRARPRKPKAPPPTGAPAGHRTVTWPSVATALLILAFVGPALAHLGEVPPRAARQPLAQFPAEFEGRVGKFSSMEAKIWEQVGGQDYVLVDYFRAGASPVNFYAVYYEIQRKGGKFVHTPRLCLPGGGWFIEGDRVRQIQGQGAALKINELVITKGGASQLVYFWYQGRGRNFTNEFAAKFYMVWDGLWRRRTDGAMVRVILPLEPGANVEEARRTLDTFALAASGKLRAFLP
jgi:exosortase D (VPLPA-CTERM-specific)